ncbi:hypothetical protein MKK58_00140 [Methylobacterium sp. J-078]|nr:hypothetical protein [Methylobacterium sp. J-078]MCJ2042974.1 hypothetical protein [Methylobacterium sp. J-078]
MPSHDGPQPDELRARRVQSRFQFSPETSAEIGRLAYGISEKLERRV